VVSGPEEIRDAARAFNELASQLNDQRASHSTFIAGVAHDLRNPIQVLRTAVDVAGKDERASSNSARIVDVIRRQLARLERLVTDLLDTTNLEAGRLTLDVADHDLRELASNVHRLVSAAEETATIELAVPSSRVSVECDGKRIEQVLLNLVNNARKYSPHDKRVLIQVVATPDHATVLVRDHGVGMSDEQLERAFLPFARGAQGRAVPGQGLGLYLSRCIVEEHGGAIRVESTPGIGSVFRIDLPRRGAPSERRRTLVTSPA
jgi:signal transduction histidine kinase